MYHSGLIKEFEPPKKVDYSNLKDPESETNKVVPPIPTDVTGDVPDAPDGFVFYRVQNGDTLVGLAVKFGISESKIRRYNNKACFGHRLTHIIGKLMLIPVNSGASMSKDVREQIASVYAEDNERKQDEEEFDGKQYTEPDENGKYQLKKALMYHAKGVDDHRAAFYLGDANWNVRNALKKWREDDIWEKMHRVAKECSLSEEEAMQKLVGMNYDDTAVIKQWQKENKKETKLMAKITSKLGRNSKKEMTDPQGIEMNIQATPKGSEEQTQEETKGDDESEMNEGQTPMSSNATDGNEKETNDGTETIETVATSPPAYSDAVGTETESVEKTVAASDVNIEETTLQ